MWDIRGTETTAPWTDHFRPIDVLYDFDGPRIFTIGGDDGEIYLAYWSAEDPEDSFDRFVIVPTNNRILNDLKSGNTTMHEALNQPHCWISDIAFDGSILKSMRVEFSDIPQNCLPSRSAMLWSSLEPSKTPAE